MKLLKVVHTQGFENNFEDSKFVHTQFHRRECRQVVELWVILGLIPQEDWLRVVKRWINLLRQYCRALNVDD